MPSKTVYLVARDGGYLSDIRVAFSTSLGAARHAISVGGEVVPVEVRTTQPTSRKRYIYDTTLRASSGMVQRRDFLEEIEWDYETPRYALGPDEIRNNVHSGVNLASKMDFVRIITEGYNNSAVQAAHEDAIKAIGGFDAT